MHSSLYSKHFSLLHRPQVREIIPPKSKESNCNISQTSIISFFYSIEQQRQKASPKVVAQRTGAARFEEYFDDENVSKESRMRKRNSQDPDIESFDNDPEIYQGVLGRPGVDFPVMTTIPKTNFECQNLGNGYFADLETSCQVSLAIFLPHNCKNLLLILFRFFTSAMKDVKSHFSVPTEQFSDKSI